ncbi:hypothetical protein K474DRAFT_332902 [Panus rudis PR-1116 ss-1]|nr:hypothetical protein K474DRAFT_332902 [Panus rudis PR-1116 ss-1]
MRGCNPRDFCLIGARAMWSHQKLTDLSFHIGFGEFRLTSHQKILEDTRRLFCDIDEGRLAHFIEVPSLWHLWTSYPSSFFLLPPSQGTISLSSHADSQYFAGGQGLGSRLKLPLDPFIIVRCRCRSFSAVEDSHHQIIDHVSPASAVFSCHSPQPVPSSLPPPLPVISSSLLEPVNNILHFLFISGVRPNITVTSK